MSILDDILASVSQSGGGEGGQPELDSPYVRQALMRGLMASMAARNANAPANASPSPIPPAGPNPGQSGMNSLGGNRAPRPVDGGEAAPMPTFAQRPNASPVTEAPPEQPPAQAEPVPVPVQTTSVSPQEMPQNPIGARPLTPPAPREGSPDAVPLGPVGSTPPERPQPSRSSNAQELFPQAQFGPGVMERVLGTVLGAPGDTTWLPGGARDQVARQQGSTVQALIAKGMDPRAAEAAALNPDIMRQLAPVLFGAKQNAEWKPIGNDKYGAPQYGWVNPNNQEVRDARGNLIGSPQQPGAAEPQHSGPDLSGFTGKDLLDKLDPGDRAQVEAILDGRQQPPSPNARNARTQRVMEWVGQAEPGFDMTTWKARNSARTEMASQRAGSPGGNLTALSTAMGHLEQLDDMSKKLNNVTVIGSTLARGLTNPIARNMEGLSDFNEREAAFNAKKKAALDEVNRVFTGSAGGVYDRKEWEGKIDASQTPGQISTTIKSLVELMKGRGEEVVSSYNRTMGSNKTIYDFVSKDGGRRMKKVLGESD